MQKNRILCFMLFFLCFLCGCEQKNDLFSVKENPSAVEEEDSFDDIPDDNPSVEKESEHIEEKTVYVYVCGHVNNPGVFQLSEESRICDALALAGGATKDGNAQVLQQAEKVQDGQTIYVPGMDEEWEQKGFEQATKQEDDLLDINLASIQDFLELPGIGESKAKSIVDFREEHGSFDSIEELMEIPGIKEGVYNKIKDKIKV